MSSPCTRKKTIILQSAMPDYRQKFLNYLIEDQHGDLCILTGEKHFASSLPAGIELGENSQYIKNYYLFGRKLLFQTGVILPAIKAKVAILELNPRIITTWIILILRKILRKNSILWGHAWSRNGRNSKTEIIRNAQRMLADCIVVYTETQKKELQEVMKGKLIVSAPNALYSSDQMQLSSNYKYKKNKIICVGRLVDEKKVDLLIKAFSIVIDKGHENIDLVVLGNGPELENLKNLTRRLNLINRVKFLGHISDINALREYYMEAYTSVAPGSVGLSLMQSMAFGVPMIISKKEPHGPEIEAAKEGFNCSFFTTNDEISLANAIIKHVEEEKKWEERRVEINNYCKTKYSIESMVLGFSQAIVSMND